MKISTAYLLPGMKISRNLYGPDGRLLLKKGAVLSARNIMSLRRAGVLAVHVDSFDAVEDEDELEEVLEDAIRYNAMNVVKEWASNTKQVSFEQLTETVEMIIDEVLEGKEVRGNLTEICSADMYTYAHSVDVCILSVMLGVKLGYAKKQLVHLGIGGLLHDLGKVKVPVDILNKPGKLTPEEFNEIKKHPLYGYQMALDENSKISRPSAEIILKHHEKYDGSGYPQGLKGNEISEMATICSIADVYNAITTDRVYRKAMPPHEAYEMIMASGGTMFDPAIVRVFLDCVTPYPVGSVVYLSNSLIGRVKKLNPGLVFRPVIALIDSQEEIDLKKETNIVISGLVQPGQVRELLVKGGVFRASASPAKRATGNN